VNKQVAEYLQQIEHRIVIASGVASKAEAQVDLAWCQFRVGEIDSAAATLDEVFALGRSLPHSEQAQVLSIATCGEGVISCQRGRYPEAVKQFLRTLEAARTASVPHIHARALAFLAVACGRLGAHREGLEYGLAGLEAGIDTNDLRAIVTARMAIANLHNEREQSELALRYLKEVTDLAGELGDPFTLGALKSSLASSSCNLATTLAANSTNDALSDKVLKQALCEANEMAEDCLAHSRAMGHVFAELCALGNLSEIAFMRGDLQEAITLIGRVHAMSIKLDSLNNMAYSLLLWGGYDLKAGRADDALGRLLEALGYAKQSGYLEAEAKIYQKLTECYEKQGRLLDALDAQRSCARALESQRVYETANLALLTEARREFFGGSAGH
jgi:tetratricopeptide (TPR) repeat protein